jgi:hypothetical protein
MEADIVASYGPPIALDTGPYGFYRFPDFVVEIQYWPKTRKVDSISYFHPEVAAQMGLRDDSEG